MQKNGKVFAVLMIVAFLLSIPNLQPLPTEAQDNGNITIESNGSITPSSAPIQQTGKDYVVTSGVKGIITVKASNIVLDGNKQTISAIILNQLSNVIIKGFIIDKDEKISLIGLSLTNSSNCLIYNNTLTGFWSIQGMNGIDVGGIYSIGSNSNLFAQNIIRDNLTGMIFINSSQNVISQNSFRSKSEYTSLISFVTSSNNTIYQNNFVCDTVSNTNTARVYYSIDSWDNGSVGNYWSDYNGSSVYVIDEKNIDQYPLTSPVDIYAVSNPTPSPSSDRNAPHLDPIFYIIPISVILTVVIVVLSSVIYRRQRKTVEIGVSQE